MYGRTELVSVRGSAELVAPTCSYVAMCIWAEVWAPWHQTVLVRGALSCLVGCRLSHQTTCPHHPTHPSQSYLVQAACSTSCVAVTCAYVLSPSGLILGLRSTPLVSGSLPRVQFVQQTQPERLPERSVLSRATIGLYCTPAPAPSRNHTCRMQRGCTRLNLHSPASLVSASSHSVTRDCPEDIGTDVGIVDIGRHSGPQAPWGRFYMCLLCCPCDLRARLHGTVPPCTATRRS